MIVYEDYHFGDPQEISLYHIREFSHFAHLHRSYELLRLKSGKLMATVDGRDFLMKPGDLILILPYEIHSYTNLEDYIVFLNPFYFFVSFPLSL